MEFGFSPNPIQIKSHCNLSMHKATSAGIGKRDRKYVGKLENVLLRRVTLPPLDKYMCFHLANHLSIFSKSSLENLLFHTPKILARASKFNTAPTGTNSYFPNLTFSLDITSNQVKRNHKCQLNPGSFSQNISVICK